MRLTRPATRRRGLSLLEIIVSLMIFLLAIGALTYMLTSSSHLAMEARTRTQAALYAHSKLNEARIGALSLTAQTEGTLDDDPDYNWSMDVSGGPQPGLHVVTVRVGRTAPGRADVKVAITQIILDPQFQGSSLDGSGTNSTTEAESSSSSSTPAATTPAATTPPSSGAKTGAAAPASTGGGNRIGGTTGGASAGGTFGGGGKGGGTSGGGKP